MSRPRTRGRNVAGHALPTMVQAFVFINLVQVDPVLLIACVVAAVAGAVIGAPIVVRLPVQVVQGIVGVALLIASGLYALSNLGLMRRTRAPPLMSFQSGANEVC